MCNQENQKCQRRYLSILENHFILTKQSIISALIQRYDNYYKFEKHIHNSIELYRILSGECKMEINNDIISCQKDDVVIIMPNTVHSFFLTTKAPCEFQHIHFTPTIFSKIFIQGADKTEIDLMTAFIQANAFFFHTVADQTLSLLISLIIEKAALPETLSHAHENLFLTEIFLYILEKSNHHISLKKFSSSKSNYVSFTLNYIHQNYSQKILIDNIANALNISSRYLSKIFFEQMNVTILTYINIYRINQAIDLMLNTNLTLTDISSQIGLKDSQHFSKLFHNIIGITPYKYKKLIQNTKYEDK